MNDKRSIIVLIITFIFLDIFLFSTFFKMRKSAEVSQHSTIDVFEQMKVDDITVTAAIPSISEVEIVMADHSTLEKQLSALKSQNYTYTDGVITSTLTTPIQLSIPAGALTLPQESMDIMNKFVNEQVVRGTQYEFFTLNLSGRKLVYGQKANNSFIMDGTGQLVFTLSETGSVVSYTQTFAGVPQAIGQNRTIMSGEEALKNVYLSGKIPTKTTVSKIAMTYYKNLSLNDMEIYSPTWYIELQLSDGKTSIRRVDALRGTVISDDGLDMKSIKDKKQ